jgi:hypothetical protein
MVSIPQSDHRLIEFKHKTTHLERGLSYWKFNDSLLYNTDFVNNMNNCIANYMLENSHMDAQTKWDLCKIKITQFCISFAVNQKLKKKNYYTELQNHLNSAEKDLSNNPHNIQLQTEVESLKRKLETFAYEDARSAHVRSRVKFIEEGEKNTKYFLNLEKARANSKIMDRFKTSMGDTVTSQEEIMAEQVRFYKDVYDKNVNLMKLRLMHS